MNDLRCLIIKNVSGILKGLCKLLVYNSLVSISIKSSDNGNYFFISSIKVLFSKKSLDVSMVQKAIMCGIYQIKGIHNVPVESLMDPCSWLPHEVIADVWSHESPQDQSCALSRSA